MKKTALFPDGFPCSGVFVVVNWIAAADRGISIVAKNGTKYAPV